jgi:thioredoxin-related protein
MIKNTGFQAGWILFLLSGMVQAQVGFTEVSGREGMDALKLRALEGGRMLFVDVYATWCGPCKMMDREVYTDPVVAEYMNSHFVNARMDGETDYGRQYATEQQLEGYPTMYIFDPDGNRINKLVGYIPAVEFLGTLQGLVSQHEQLMRYGDAYRSGILNPEDYAPYVRVLRETGQAEEAGNLVAEYRKNHMGEELTDSDIGVLSFYMDLEDPWWPEFTREPERIQRILGEDYIPAMEEIYNKTLVKAVEQENISLISRMANELSPLVEMDGALSWDLRSLPFIQYFYYTDQHEQLISYIDGWFASDRKGDHRWLFGAASQVVDMDQKFQTPVLMEKGEEWFLACIAMEEQYDYLFYHGMVLLFQKKTTEARISFERALALAVTDDQRSMVNQVLQYLEYQ